MQPIAKVSMTAAGSLLVDHHLSPDELLTVAFGIVEIAARLGNSDVGEMIGRMAEAAETREAWSGGEAT